MLLSDRKCAIRMLQTHLGARLSELRKNVEHLWA